MVFSRVCILVFLCSQSVALPTRRASPSQFHWIENEDNSQLSTPVVGQSAVDRNQVNASFVRLEGDVKHTERESNSTSNSVTQVVLNGLAVDRNQVNASFVRLEGDVKHTERESNSTSNPVTHVVLNELEVVKADSPKVNKLLYIMFSMFFGFCGCDRCFMGQVAFGCLKGFTLGGFLIWAVIDYWVAVACALSKDKDIDMIGYKATFSEGSIQIAFWFCIGALIYAVYTSWTSFSQWQVQYKEQSDLLRQIDLLQREQAQRQGRQQTPEPSSEALDIPMRHQSLAFVPTALTRNLRKAGLVAEKPTIPELIAAFEAMDVNKDGLLDRAEIKAGMTAMGATDEVVEEMIKTADTDGDGQISKHEFLVAYHAKGGV